MNKTICVLIFLLLAGTGAQAEAAGTGLTVSRFVVSGSIKDKEPADVRESFDLSDRKVYCFLEATDVEADTSVSFVWYHMDEEVARVEVPVRKGPRWRTFCSKKLGDRKGPWRVELRDQSDEFLESVEFTVQ